MGYRSQICCSRSTGRPLMAYASEYEAKYQAEYSARVHQTTLSAYRCRTCSCWHLAPRLSRVVLGECYQCCGRDGRSKVIYPTEDDAMESARRIGANGGESLRVYECRYSEGWHLTSKW
jgi:hypothetical protein